MMCATCMLYGGDGADNTIRMVTGHHPSCADFKINKNYFVENLQYTAQQIADRMLATEMPKLKAMYEPKKPKEVKEISEARFQEAVYHLRFKDKVIVPNAHYFCGENDLISVNKSDFVTEFEIKISKADFKADFKKTAKHDLLKRCYEQKWRKQYYSGGFLPYPNYFFYVVPQGMLDEKDIPDYAGLIIVNDFGQAFKKKNAPRLHSDKITAKQIEELMRKMFYRYWNLRLK
jgi:hypothetical protein